MEKRPSEVITEFLNIQCLSNAMEKLNSEFRELN